MTAVRRMQLARLGVWIGLATVAVLTAVLTARTETGVRRIATLISPAPAQPEPVRSAKGPAPQLANRQFDQEAEQRHLSEAIRTLAADRDRLLARLNTLERSVEDVTGSIAAPTPKVSPPTPLPSIPASPPRAAGSTPPAAPAAGAAQTPLPRQSDPRCGRTFGHQQPDRGRVGRDQNRIRGRSRRQRHDRRAAHHVVKPEGDPARHA